MEKDGPRKRARIAGLPTYQGKTCKRGHGARRRTDSGACVVCHKESAARQYAKIKSDPAEYAYHLLRWNACVKGVELPPKQQWIAQWRAAQLAEQSVDGQADPERCAPGDGAAEPVRLGAGDFDPKVAVGVAEVHDAEAVVGGG